LPKAIVNVASDAAALFVSNICATLEQRGNLLLQHAAVRSLALEFKSDQTWT